MQLPQESSKNVVALELMTQNSSVERSVAIGFLLQVRILKAVEFDLRDVAFETRPLSDEDTVELQSLLERCSDYFELVLNRPTGPADSLGVFYAGPEEGTDPKNKLLLGIEIPGVSNLVGVFDAFYDYPDEGIWYIGLILIAPDVRGSGLGDRIIETFARQAQRAGARELQINVVEQNARAYAFWLRHGFVEMRRWRQRFGERDSVFIRMRRTLMATAAS